MGEGKGKEDGEGAKGDKPEWAKGWTQVGARLVAADPRTWPLTGWVARPHQKWILEALLLDG